MTHIGANFDAFKASVTLHPDIDFFQTPDHWIYNNCESLDYLSTKRHKNLHAASIYGDILLFNHKFQRKLIKPCYQFIFYAGEPVSSIQLIHNQGYEEDQALSYYLFRLQGLYEFAVRTNGIIARHDDWKLEEIFDYLKLQKPNTMHTNQIEEVTLKLKNTTIKQAEKAYANFLVKTNALTKKVLK